MGRGRPPGATLLPAQTQNKFQSSTANDLLAKQPGHQLVSFIKHFSWRSFKINLKHCTFPAVEVVIIKLYTKPLRNNPLQTLQMNLQEATCFPVSAIR